MNTIQIAKILNKSNNNVMRDVKNLIKNTLDEPFIIEQMYNEETKRNTKTYVLNKSQIERLPYSISIILTLKNEMLEERVKKLESKLDEIWDLYNNVLEENKTLKERIDVLESGL